MSEVGNCCRNRNCSEIGLVMRKMMFGEWRELRLSSTEKSRPEAGGYCGNCKHKRDHKFAPQCMIKKRRHRASFVGQYTGYNCKWWVKNDLCTE